MIELKNISFAYENCENSLHNINLKIHKNECVVLIGCSGNGKTTLTRIMNGLAPSHFKGTLQGEILIDGENINQLPLWKYSRLVGSVFQDPKSQFFSSEITGEIAFGLENNGFPTCAIQDKTDAIILKNGLNSLKNRSLDLLSSGEKQKTAIASVEVLQPNIYVFDEPTANLDEDASFSLAQTIKRLKASGHTLIIAEHRLSYLSEIADRYIYMKNGRIDSEYTSNQLKALTDNEKTAIGIRSILYIKKKSLPKVALVQKNPSIQVVNLTVKRGKNVIIKNTSFSAQKEDIVAITGKNGVGKTTISKAICGIFKEKEGSIYISGKKVTARNRNKYVWYSSNDTNTQFFTNSLTEELLLLLDKSNEVLEKAREILRYLDLYELKDIHPSTLSGGQKQRLSIACGILSDREILIFDEPTSGLDGLNLQIVADIFKTIANKGKTIFVVTHDNELINACCTLVVEL